MNIPYEILIRGKEDGTYSGAHAIDKPGDPARPLTPADLAEIAPDIDAAALARIGELETERDQARADAAEEIASMQAERDALLALKNHMDAAVPQILAMPDGPEKVAAMMTLGQTYALPAKEAERQKKIAERDRLDAEIAELEAATKGGKE